MYFVYILQSNRDETYYIGQTENLKKRLEQHNLGISKYTKTKRPWKIVYIEEFKTRKNALSRERFLKKQRNRQFYEKLIKNYESLIKSD